MKPRTTKKRKAPIGSPEAIAEYCREQEQFQRGFLRRIRAWARTWERCPLAGCRRNDRCLREDACRGVSDEPLTEEERLLISAAIEEMRAESTAEKPALHDPKN